MGLLDRPIAQISAKVLPFTPIDLLSLFDKVVFHEVYSIFKSTFTRVQELILSSLVSSLIRDMQAKHLTPRSMSTLAFSNVAYGEQRSFIKLHRVPLNDSGWKNCMKISTNLPDNGGPSNGKPMNNADSYGLFASGKFIIFQIPLTEIDEKQAFV